MKKELLGGKVILHGGDSRDILKTLPDNSIDSIVTDPPYALVSIVKRFGKENAAPAKEYEGKSGAYRRASAGFMGKSWDTGEVAFDPDFWAECYRVLKPGGHIMSFGGTRTFHRMVCAIEDAGFEIRDMVQWLYGTGFPKSHDVSKGIDKAAARNKTTFEKRSNDAVTPEAAQWEGWGTALKPANEPICLARKHLSEKTVAANVLKWGTGALNIDACRIPINAAVDDKRLGGNGTWSGEKLGYHGTDNTERHQSSSLGRFPANIIHDGSDEVTEHFPTTGKSQGVNGGGLRTNQIYGEDNNERLPHPGYGDEGSAARYFYCVKASKKERAGSKHPTVKPINLFRYLIRLITPPNGIVLDPFAGSGTTGEAAYMEGMSAILIEREEEYQKDIERRINGLGEGDIEELLNVRKDSDEHADN